MAAGATYEPIATTTLGSTAATVTFSGISSAYTDLKVVIVATAATGGNFGFRFNSDTGTNYSRTMLRGNGTTASSGSSTNIDYFQLTNGATIGTTPSLHTVDLFSYAGSTYKTILYTENSDYNGSGSVVYQVGLWRSTSAINRIDFFQQSGTDFAAGSTFTIYGIKAA